MRHKVARCSLIVGIVCFVFSCMVYDAEPFLHAVAAVAFACMALFGKGDWRYAGVFLFAVSFAFTVADIGGLRHEREESRRMLELSRKHFEQLSHEQP
jgi:membrane protein implicated in regulation of membrane protease activity